MKKGSRTKSKSSTSTPTKADYHRLLTSRRSIRKFSTRKVNAATIDRILKTTLFAPSAHNGQPWRFALLKSPEKKKSLVEAMAVEFKLDLEREALPAEEIESRINRSRSRINAAPVAVVICMDHLALGQMTDSKKQQAEITMGVQSTAMAGLQLMLAAHAEGLGAVWTCGPLFAPEAVRSSLSLPASWEPQGLILLGYPSEKPKEKSLLSLQYLVKYVE